VALARYNKVAAQFKANLEAKIAQFKVEHNSLTTLIVQLYDSLSFFQQFIANKKNKDKAVRSAISERTNTLLGQSNYGKLIESAQAVLNQWRDELKDLELQIAEANKPKEPSSPAFLPP